MIVKALLSIIFGLLRGVVSLFPTFSNYGDVPQGLLTMLYIGFQFFPVDVFIAVITPFVFWTVVHLSYGLYRFIRRA